MSNPGPRNQSDVVEAPLLSLAMIVRDGGHFLASLLEAAQPHVDEIVIGDTGSTDGSGEVARAAGARVLDLPWTEDFAEARNKVLTHCRGSWILVLDADEQLAPCDWADLRNWIAIRDLSPIPVAGSILTRNYLPGRHGRRGWVPVPDPDPHALPTGSPAPGYVPSTKVRIFPNLPSIHFKGQLHETVEASLWEAGLVVEQLEAPVHHFGMLTADEDKNRRYLKLALRKTSDQPHDPAAWAELADCAIATGDNHQALVAIERAIVLDPADPDRKLTAGWLLIQMGRLEQADTMLLAVTGSPRTISTLRAEALHLRAQIALQVEDPRRASELLEAAINLDADNGHFLNTLGACRMLQGRADPAIEALLRARDLLPGVLEPVLNLARLYEAADRLELADRYLDEAAAIEPDSPKVSDARRRLADLVR